MICIEDIELETFQVGGTRFGSGRSLRGSAPSGKFVRSEQIAEGERDYDIAVDATLRAALLRQSCRLGDSGFSILESDIRKKIYLRPRKSLILFVVDSSDSMGEGTHARIKSAKGAVLAILAKAYKKRYRVGMVVFRDESAELILPPTSSLSLAREKLKRLPTGGATPFAAGLMKAWQVVRSERLKNPGVRPLLVILSDGEANVPYDIRRSFSEVTEELFLIAGRIGSDTIDSITVDTRPLHKPRETMSRLAGCLGGQYHHISQLKSSGMAHLVARY